MICDCARLEGRYRILGDATPGGPETFLQMVAVTASVFLRDDKDLLSVKSNRIPVDSEKYFVRYRT